MTSNNGGNTANGFLAAWPAHLMVLLVVAAALYSFAHRPLPAFAPTAVRPDKLLVNGLAQQGDRLIAAGELGHILVANSPDGPWQPARVEPARGSTFTRAAFVGDRLALAVGHDGWIVRSADAGASWQEVAFDESRPDPLLGIAGPYDGRLFAFGAFGLFMTSADQGQTWQSAPLNIEEAGGAKKPAPEVDPDADPFANFTAQDSQADRHLNAMTRLPDGSLVLVGERGLVLQSRDLGASWKPLGDSGYEGSFFGVLALAQDGNVRVLAYGMRGNAFYTDDQGKTWTRAETPRLASLFSGTVLKNGDVVLVGDNNTILLSQDRGAHFALADEARVRGLAAGLAEVIELPDGLLTVGDGGIVRRPAPVAKAGAAHE
jgi:photosystem II stability/assembly factor-like uncharacterized protein